MGNTDPLQGLAAVPALVCSCPRFAPALVKGGRAPLASEVEEARRELVRGEEHLEPNREGGRPPGRTFGAVQNA